MLTYGTRNMLTLRRCIGSSSHQRHYECTRASCNIAHSAFQAQNETSTTNANVNTVCQQIQNMNY